MKEKSKNNMQLIELVTGNETEQCTYYEKYYKWLKIHPVD